MSTINQRFFEARKARGETLESVSKKIGIGTSALSKIETGVTKSPAERTVMLFAYKLGINENWLRTGEGEMEPETDLLSQMQCKYNLTPEVSAIVAEFIDLPAAAQEIIVQYVRDAANRIQKLRDKDEERAEHHAKESSPEQSEEHDDVAE